MLPPTPAAAPPTLAVAPPTLAVTSLPLSYLSTVPRDFAGTLFWRPLGLPLLCYYDGRGTPRRPNLPANVNVTFIRLADVSPWARAAVAQGMRPDGWLQADYAAGRLECLVWSTRGHCKDVFTAFKVAAIVAAAEANPLARLLWCDTDVFAQRPLDARFWQWASRVDVATIGRQGHPPDTGVLLLHAAVPSAQLPHATARAPRVPAAGKHGSLSGAARAFAGVRGLLRAAVAAFTDRAVLAAAGSANDVFVLDHLLRLHAARGLRVGWFAVGCRPARGVPCRPRSAVCSGRWVTESLVYKVRPHVHFCPAASHATNVSHFNLFEYLTHGKKKRGPIHAGEIAAGGRGRDAARAAREAREGSRLPSHLPLTRPSSGRRVLRDRARADHGLRRTRRFDSQAQH